MRSIVNLVVIDSSDSLRPPAFDIMMIIISSLGAALATIQPISEPHVAARIILDPTLFAATIFLALRGSAGIAGLIQRGIMDVYLSYPVSRRSVFLIIYISRVVLPAGTLLVSPLLVAAIVLFPVVSRDPASYIIVFAAYLVQAVMFGSIFLLLGLVARSTGSASVASITVYFAYNITSLLLSIIGTTLRSDSMTSLADAMSFYYMVYRSMLGVEVELWQFLLVPAIILLVILAGYIYFTRRFEPR
ncbi:MAG: ABC transporter permease [Desulfurococcales archaeon]|nr:ABC transporter permease [Desulfurococcales archaeon]